MIKKLIERLEPNQAKTGNVLSHLVYSVAQLDLKDT